MNTTKIKFIDLNFSPV